MKTATKKLTAYLLLLLAAVPFIYFLVFKIQQDSIRHEMKGRLNEQILHTISIPEHEIHWIKNGKEISVKGRMFDIRSFYFQNGAGVFSGLYDEEETVLMEQLQKEQQNNSTNSKQLTQLFQLLQSFYNDPQHEIFFPYNQPGYVLIKDNPTLISQFISIIIPPPRA